MLMKYTVVKHQTEAFEFPKEETKHSRCLGKEPVPLTSFPVNHLALCAFHPCDNKFMLV